MPAKQINHCSTEGGRGKPPAGRETGDSSSSVPASPSGKRGIPKSSFLRSLILLGAIALLVRVAIALALGGHPSVQHPSAVTDMATYLRLAKEICAGQWPDHFDYQPFYYSLFLPLGRLLSGDSPWGYILLQILLGTAAVLLTADAARKLLGERWGLLAGLLLAISRLHVFYTPFALFEVLQSFWLALLLWLVLRCREKQRLWLWGATAFLFGCSTLTRGNVLLLFPGFLLFFLLQKQKSWLQKTGICLLMVLLFEIPQLPYALRNYHYLGRWCGASTAGEKVLALGNTPEAPAGGLEYPMTYHKWVSEADAPGYARVPMRRNILKWMCQEPLIFANLQWEKLLLFWDRAEIPNNVSLEQEGKAAPWLQLLLPTHLLLALAFLGMLTAWRKPTAENLFLYYAVLVLWGATALFYLLARFRLCALPWLAIFAAAGGRFLWDRLQAYKHLPKHQKRQWLALSVLPVLLSLFLVYRAYDLWQETVTPALFRLSRPRGTFVEFERKRRLYDHGPLASNLQLVSLPENSPVLEKEFLLPENGTPPPKITFRLMLFRGDATLEINGKKYPTAPGRDRFRPWASVTIPSSECRTTEGKLLTKWHLSQDAVFALSTSRNYHRTRDLTGEAFVEMEWETP